MAKSTSKSKAVDIPEPQEPDWIGDLRQDCVNFATYLVEHDEYVRRNEKYKKPTLSKYTVERLTKILFQLAMGGSVIITCRSQGISRETYYDWIDKKVKLSSILDRFEGIGIATVEGWMHEHAFLNQKAGEFFLKKRAKDVYGDNPEDEKSNAHKELLQIFGNLASDVKALSAS